MAASSFLLRFAELDDVASLVLCFTENNPQDSDQQQQLLLECWRRCVQLSIDEPSQHVVVVAQVQQSDEEQHCQHQVVGFQSFLPFLPHFHFRRVTGMSSTYVRRVFHRTRVGSQLMVFGIERVRHHTQLTRLYGHTNQANRSINALVTRQGWTLIGQTALGSGTDIELIWELVVTRAKL